ncbi:MAG: DEAD/DEAH box helicase [Candidatus Hodarchaeales archaeon]
MVKRACSLCTPAKFFNSEEKYWEHVNEAHPEYIDDNQIVIVPKNKCRNCKNLVSRKKYNKKFDKVSCKQYCSPNYPPPRKKPPIPSHVINRKDITPIISIISESNQYTAQIQLKIGEETINYFDIKQRKNQLQIKGKCYTTKTKLIGIIKNQIERYGFKVKNKSIPIKPYEVFIIEAFSKKIKAAIHAPPSFLDLLEDYKSFKLDSSYSLPPEREQHLENSEIILRPYQREGIQWLEWLSNNKLNGILADDMGLGKTAQALLTVHQLYYHLETNHNTLILCPLSVVSHWKKEIRRFLNKAAWIYSIDKKTRRKLFEKISYPSRKYIISTYDTVVNDIKYFQDLEFEYIILDEATKIKNPNTKRTRAIKKLKSKRKIALTGTPIENRPQELWSIFDFLNKGHLGSRTYFLTHYDEPIVNLRDTTKQTELGYKIKPFILRRTKENVAKDLPEKIITPYEIELTRVQEKLYYAAQDDALSEYQDYIYRGKRFTSALARSLFNNLKYVCNHPALVTNNYNDLFRKSNKFDQTIEIIDDLLNADERAVIFTQYLNTLSLFERYFSRNDISYERIDGSLNYKKRESIIHDYNNKNFDILLCSVRAAGYGINLTGGNHVIHYDRWWNPAVEDQATDRIHRIGQTKTVFVHYFITRDTIEEKIDRLLAKKRDISTGILGELNDNTEFSHEEIIEILTRK